VWIPIEQSVMVSVSIIVLWVSPSVIGHEQLSLLIMGGAHWGIDNYRPFNYLSDFDENQ